MFDLIECFDENIATDEGNIESRMADQALLLAEFRKSFERLEAVRAQANGSEDAYDVEHAEQNFYACAESLARLLPKATDVT